jgi:hypothetical protein
LATDEVAGELIGKVARKDPELAFVLLGDMEHGDPRPFVSEIFTAAATSEERTAAYAAFKDFVFTIADPVLKREIEFKAGDTLRQEIMGDGFDAASSWIDSAELSQAELEGFVDRMDLAPASHDSGKWVDWLANKLPPEKAEKPIKSIVSEWTEADYIAAGVWLADSPDSPSKTPSIIAYAETIAPYEPEVAADWAMTLTNEADRRSALWKIYQNWPAADSEGAAAFAATHNFR